MENILVYLLYRTTQITHIKPKLSIAVEYIYICVCVAPCEIGMKLVEYVWGVFLVNEHSNQIGIFFCRLGK